MANHAMFDTHVDHVCCGIMYSGLDADDCHGYTSHKSTGLIAENYLYRTLGPQVYQPLN